MAEAKCLVERINKLSRESPGGEAFHNLGVSKEDAGKHCPMCRLRGCCLGPSCLGISGMKMTLFDQFLSVSFILCVADEPKTATSSSSSPGHSPQHRIPGLNTSDFHPIVNESR